MLRICAACAARLVRMSSLYADSCLASIGVLDLFTMFLGWAYTDYLIFHFVLRHSGPLSFQIPHLKLEPDVSRMKCLSVSGSFAVFSLGSFRLLGLVLFAWSGM